LTEKVIIITGAAGFIGSSLVVELSGSHYVIALDQRKPSQDLIDAAANVKWEDLDIADAVRVNSTFKKIKETFGRIDFVIHLAAYYHFGNDWRSEYERTNIRGTENIIRAAINTGIHRIIFSSSVATLEPPQPGQALHEASSASDYIPYARSKSIGEDLFKKASSEIPCTVLRFGGVFSDWCELPPLYSLIRLWSLPGFISRMIPGRGTSGIPYIHIFDAIKIIEQCIHLNSSMSPFEILMASPDGAVSHKDIFMMVQRSLDRPISARPIDTSRGLVTAAMYIKMFLAFLQNKESYEQPWMSKFIDHPWVVNSTNTQKRLKWKCSPDLDILNKLPVILENYRKYKRMWIERNVLRNAGKYSYHTGL
jgi:nucleoside-diphosphate-sugar epimerase